MTLEAASGKRKVLAKRFLEGPLSSRELHRLGVADYFEEELHHAECSSAYKPSELHRSSWLPAVAPPPNLFPYQEEIVDDLLQTCNDPSFESGLLSLPTGGGKTTTALSFLLRWIESADRPASILWLAPRRELLEQAALELRRLWFSGYRPIPLMIGKPESLNEGQGTPDHHSVRFTTAEQLLSEGTGHETQVRHDYIVFDEAHQAIAPGRLRLLVDLCRRSRTRLLGLSATPGRTSPSETRSLVSLFSGNLFYPHSLRPNAIHALQSAGVLAQLRFRNLARETGSHAPKGGVSTGGWLIESLSLDNSRFQACLQALAEEFGQGRLTLAFCGSVVHSAALAAACRASCIPAASLTGDDSPAYRVSILESFRQGKIRVLCNAKLLTMGYDLPRLDSILLTTPVNSPIQFEQIVGRVSRGPACGGTEVGHVLDLDNHLDRLGLPSSYHRFEDFDWKQYQGMDTQD